MKENFLDLCNILSGFVVWIIGLVLIYSTGIFVEWDWNPENWYLITRISAGVLTLVYTSLVLCAMTED